MPVLKSASRAASRQKPPVCAIRAGLGYDIHRTRPGRTLRLGGVSFPRAGFTLDGHSDADVILHAACDALLGAAALPDIGRLFPNTARCHRNRNSLEFLAKVRRKLERRHYRILNLDCTLLAEKPKIAKQVPLMRRRMAQALGISAGQVGVKATTHEGLGAIGQGQGLAALAVAMISQE